MTIVEPPAWPYPVIAEVEAELGKAGLADLKDRVHEELEREGKEEAAVVFVGETNTGKSSLINALVMRHGLLPVGVDVATNVHIALRYAPATHMTVHFDRPLPDGADSRTFDTADVATWASVDGNPDNTKGVRAVELGLDAPLLAGGLTLIDTPGVGGIDAAHGRVTLAALQGADSLVFVADSDRPLIRPELDFLERATERIPKVIFVFTKIDVKPGWRKIMDEDQKLIAEHAPRFSSAQFIGVSSLLELTASEWQLAGKPDAVVQQLKDESGMGSLRSFLVEDVARKVHWSRRDTVMRLNLQGLELLEARDHAVAEAGPALLEKLQAEEARLAALETAASTWPQRVNDGFVRLRSRLQANMSDLTKEMGLRYGDQDLVPYFGRPDALKEALLREINAIGAELTIGLRAGVESIEREVIEIIAPAGLDVTDADLPASGSIESIDTDLRGQADHYQEGVRVRNVRLGYSAIAQGMSFSGIGHLGFLAFLGISSVSFFGLGMGFGALLAAAEVAGHRRQAKLQELRPLVGEALQIAQQKLPIELQDTMMDVQRRLESETRKRIKEEQKQAAEARKKCQEMIQAPPEIREKALRESEAHLAVLANLRARCERRHWELEELLAGRATLAAAG